MGQPSMFSLFKTETHLNHVTLFSFICMFVCYLLPNSLFLRAQRPMRHLLENFMCFIKNILKLLSHKQADFISHNTHSDPHTVLEGMHHLVRFHHITTPIQKLHWTNVWMMWGNSCPELFWWTSSYEMIMYILRKWLPLSGIFPLLSSWWDVTVEGVNGRAVNKCWLKAFIAFCYDSCCLAVWVKDWYPLLFSLFISVFSCFGSFYDKFVKTTRVTFPLFSLPKSTPQLTKRNETQKHRLRSN